MVNRFRGCLLGLAVGDALGAPVEGLSREQIRAEHGILTEMTGGWNGQLKAGQTTDDTALMLCVLHSYLERGGFDPQDMADRFLGWFNTSAFGIGTMTRLACEQLGLGCNFEVAGRRAWEPLPADQRQGNGSLMRAAPTGLLHYHDEVHLIGESRVVSGITHYDETCKMACVALNLALSHLLLADAHGLVEEVLDFVGPRNNVLGEALKVVPHLGPGNLLTSGYVVDTLQSALWAAVFCESFEEGLTILVNLGGDTDTVAAVAGALLGARYGVQAIPSRWLDVLQDRELINDGAIRLWKMAEEG